MYVTTFACLISVSKILNLFCPFASIYFNVLQYSVAQSKSSCSQMFFRIGRIFQISQETTCTAVSPLIKPQGEGLYLKEAPTHLLPCEIFEIFKNTLFYRKLVVASSGSRKGRGVFLELEHFDKQSCTTSERKVPQGKISCFFSCKPLKF